MSFHRTAQFRKQPRILANTQLFHRSRYFIDRVARDFTGALEEFVELKLPLLLTFFPLLLARLSARPADPRGFEAGR